MCYLETVMVNLHQLCLFWENDILSMCSLILILIFLDVSFPMFAMTGF